MPALYTLDRLRSEYVSLFDKMEIANSKRPTAKLQATRIIRSKDRYKCIEDRTKVPWFVIGCLHMRESDGDFNTYLGNGDPLNRPTTNVPTGRGPFASFEDGAYDALVTVENLDDIKDWGPEHVAYAAEKFNGFAYRQPSRNIPSPYLWGGTNIQKRGKFVRDHVYDPNVMDTQLGAMAVLRMLMDLDPEATFEKVTPEKPAVRVDPSPPPEIPSPPLSPRADDTESEVKPLSKSKTIWTSIVQWVTSNTAMVFGFIDKHPEYVAGFVVLSSIGLFLVISGRINVQKMLKHLSQDDTVKA